MDDRELDEFIKNLKQFAQYSEKEELELRSNLCGADKQPKVCVVGSDISHALDTLLRL